jgi:cytochrome c oxidase cbb3-type subunit III
MNSPRDELLEHEFDGIREYNNPPPNWIMYILYTSIVFAVGYWVFFHVFNLGSLPVKKYDQAVAAAAEAQLAKMATQEVSDQSLLLMSQVPARVDEGRQIFQQFCIACHMPDGSGNVGPNLTDAYWIHGGKPLQILNTVTYGVPEKGMVAWRDQLGPARVQKVVAFVLTLKGKNLPGKAPQGVLETLEPAPPAPRSNG